MYQDVEIVLSCFLSVVPALFHIFCIDLNISFFQAQACASQFYTLAQGMYQELEIILNGSILSIFQVLFHTFCKDDNISLSQAQASAIHQHIACTKKFFFSPFSRGIVPYFILR